jgi:hypothetical protein
MACPVIDLSPAAAPFGVPGDVAELGRLFSPGMVLLSRSPRRLANLFIPGFWKHAAICTSGASPDSPGRVVEATVGRGVAERSLADFAHDKHDLAILRPMIPARALRDFAAEAVRRIGAAYDFGFSAAENGQYYCSKLVFDCLRAVLGCEPFSLRTRLGRRLVTANDFYEERGCFDVVLETRLGTSGSRSSQPLSISDLRMSASISSHSASTSRSRPSHPGTGCTVPPVTARACV